jgi:ATP-dependent DNA helicase RecQ
LRRFQAAPAVLDERDVRAVVRVLVRLARADPAAVARAAGRSRRRTEAVVGRLEEAGVVEVEPGGTVRVVAELDPAALAADVVQAQDRRRRNERSRVEMFRGYAETQGCRRRYLLNYLGEEYTPPCGACDRCLAADEHPAAGAAEVDVTAGSSDGFALNDRVRHVKHGPGVVSRVEGGRIVVAFDDSGYRVLDLEACRTANLLRREG